MTIRSIPTWVRLAFVALALPNFAAGLWAVLSPQGWFDSFPGFDPRLVAAEPPFNAHLATDAGAGLLASGLVMLAAAWFADTRTARVAIMAYAGFAIPHAAYHVLEPAPGLSSAQDVQNAAVLVFAAVATVGLWFVVGRADQGEVEPEPAPARV